MPFDEQIVRKKQLENQITELQKELEEIQVRQKKPILTKIAEVMSEYDISLEEVRSAVRQHKGRKPIAPAKVKYRDPQTMQAWSGRGKAPKWVTDAESRGKSREEFLVEGAEA